MPVVCGIDPVARRAGPLRRPGLPVDPQVSKVGNPRKGLPRDEHAVAALDRITEQDQRPEQAQPPEGLRDDHPPLAFGGIPLHEEPAEENRVAHPSDDLPDMPLDPQKTPFYPDQSRIGQPLHGRIMEKKDAIGAEILLTEVGLFR